MIKLIVGIVLCFLGFVFPAKNIDDIKTFSESIRFIISLIMFLLGICMVAISLDDVFKK